MSLTIDDVFHVFDKSTNDIMYSFSIKENNNDRKYTFKDKLYIKIMDECPICLESIASKKNAYLTNCGHAFHKTCIHELVFNNVNASCPVCRNIHGIGPVNLFSDDYHRYKNKNDDYEFYGEFKYPRYCTECWKIEGSNNNNCLICNQCNNFKFGLVYYTN